MSLVTDSPVHSSSSDDFAAYLDSALDSNSSGSAPDDEASKSEEVVDDSDLKSKRSFGDMLRCKSCRCGWRLHLPLPIWIKRSKVEILEKQEDQSTSHVVLQTEMSSKSTICTHPGSFGDMCIVCGERLNEESGVTLAYIHKGLRLEKDEINRLCNTDMKNLLRQRKLYLVLDLDHTLLNTTLLTHTTPEEEYLKAQTDSLQDIPKGNLFMLEYMRMMTKLRPFVRSFLKEASKMFEMYIYTMGDRPYAQEMAKLLDPHREYFSGRVISRDDGTQRHQKGLDIVLGQESAVLILDDTENAWAKHKDNLILMERYHFFASSCRQFGYNCKSLSELKSDESEPEGALASILKVLKRTHQMFFDELQDDLTDRDVRQALKTIRKEVLRGCKIVFSRVFPTKFQAENHHLWKIAEQLGATCVTEVGPTVTHVVSTDVGTEKSRWAVKQKRFLVHPQWLEAANYLWEKKPEEKFPVTKAEEE